ncbi:mavicyanin-like [Pistacia vera]|uniref:mavicyanin-like n=1 Tax=Pistacia vera TaxID=55513 RepID=UPI001263A6CA|nr:mavicyanin-like [Pistacia vera]
MANSKLLIILVIVATYVPSILATDFVVGDATGWTTKFDYQKWAEGKEFRVGDKLIFNYPQGAHNLMRITDAASYQQCVKSPNARTSSSGSDEIILSSPGKKWYICGVGQHCEVGNQKLAITVLAEGETLPPVSAPSPSTTPPPSAATGRTASLFYGFMAVVAAFVGILMV